MPYQARMYADGTWDLEAPDGTTVEAGKSLPVDESDGALWSTIAKDAQTNQRMGEALATIAVGLTIIDER